MRNIALRVYSFLLLISIGLLPVYIARYSVGGISTNAFEILVFSIVCIGISTREVRGQWKSMVDALPKRLILAGALFFVSACIAAALSDEQRVSAGILKSWFIIPAIWACMTAAAVRASKIQLSRCITILLVSGVAVSLVGISQLGTLTRVRSLYDVPNSLSLFLVPLIILAVYSGFYTKNILRLGMGFIMFVAVLATQSAGAIGALLGALIVWFVLESRKRIPSYTLRIGSMIACIALVAGSVLFVSGRIQYLISPLLPMHTSNSVTVRMQLWDVGIRLIRQHPLLGIGLGQFEPVYQKQLHQLFELSSRGVPVTSYKLQAEYVFRDPHNFLISFWLNMGILGLLAFCYINFTSIRHGMRSKNSEQQAIALSLIAMLLYGLVDTIYWKNDLSALWWVLIALGRFGGL